MTAQSYVKKGEKDGGGEAAAILLSLLIRVVVISNAAKQVRNLFVSMLPATI